MAVVYKAYDTRLEREVALKVIRTESIPPAQLDKLMKRFEREAKAQAQFAHNNIVHVYDYGKYENAPYLIMEYLSGGTLKAMTGQPIPYQQAAKLLAPIADAVAYAHARNILHRDVKPSNILITKEGKPVLTDFGIAKILEAEGTALTGTGLGVGTPAYMAPEQWRGEPVEQTDIYGLGVVFFELVTGRKPYEADTPAAIVQMQVIEPLPRPSDLVPGIPQNVERVLFKALALKPEDRYESMAAFGTVLAELSQEASIEIEEVAEEETLVAVELPTRPEPEPAPVMPPIPVSEQETSDDFLVIPPREPIQKKKPWLWIGLGLFFAVVVICGGFGLVLFGDELMARSNKDTTVTSLASIATATSTEIQMPTVTLAQATADFPTPTGTLPLHTPTPTLGIGSTLVREKDSMEMALIPAGEFEMGSEGGVSNESPVHTVYLDAYWIDRFEVTNAQFALFVDETGYVTTAEEQGWSWVYDGNSWEETEDVYWREPGDAKGKADVKTQSPVIHVSWQDAKAYCDWAGARLPTEAEWEKAARGGLKGRVYPWGDAEPICALSAENGAQFKNCSGQVLSVGSFASNGYGLFDMAGNVWEWVADWYDSNYYALSPTENPPGPSSGSYRVFRGGSWNYSDGNLRVAYRGSINPGHTDFNLGFRCALSP
jgi:formylglycine-generating enzyme required for sulfatase activity